MKYVYIGGQLTATDEKKPYDAPSIDAFCKQMGVSVLKERTNNQLNIETDKELTPEQMQQLETELNKYDLSRTKKIIDQDENPKPEK